MADGPVHTDRPPDADLAAQLATSETRYASLVAAMSDGVLLRYADGTMEPCNAAAVAILGLGADELAARTSVDSRWRAVHEDGTTFADAGPSRRRHPADRRDAPRRRRRHPPTRWRVPLDLGHELEPLVADGETTPYAALCSLTDITERRATARALEASERAAHEAANLFSNVLEAATEYAMVGSDLAGTITVFNRGAERMLGYDAADVVGTAHAGAAARSARARAARRRARRRGRARGVPHRRPGSSSAPSASGPTCTVTAAGSRLRSRSAPSTTTPAS